MSPLAKSAPSAVVGLDIGTDMTKVAEARLAKGGGIEITGLAVMPTPEGTIDNSLVVDPQKLGAAIKQLLRDSGIKAKHVVSSISGQSSVVVRVIDVPKMSLEELSETMKWEVERHVPFAPNEIQMDFAPIEKPNTPPDAPNMEVLLAVAQQDAVNAHVQTLLAAGLEPIAIDVQPLAISRPLVDAANGSQPHSVAIVNIGASTTDVGVYEGGLLAFPGPPLPIAGINLTRAVSEALGVTLEEAEILKREYGQVDISSLQAAAPDAVYAPTDAGYPPPGTGAADDADASAAPAAPAAEPTPLDTSVPQADSDFSPFDFGVTPPPPPPPAEKPLDPSGEEVFDLGGGEPAQDFKPVFDLDGPDAVPEQPAPPSDVGTAAEPPAADLGVAAEAEAAAPDTAYVQAADQPPAPEPAYDAPAATPAHDQDTAKRVSDAIAPVLVELATEVRRSIDYYTTRYQNRPERIFLCGGTAKMRDLDQFLANELGIPVQLADPMAHLTVNCPKYSPQYLSEVAPLFPVSIGLAIREMLE